MGSVYERWSRHPGLLDRLYDLVFLGRQPQLRARSVGRLGLAPGDRVLELGCGAGNSLHALRTRVGPEGRVVGVDASPGMVRAARDRVAAAGWDNVSVLAGDATRPPVRGPFDAVYAAMSLSAVDDPAAAVGAARDVLRPGGRLSVLDARPFDGALAPLNRALVPLLAPATDWTADADLVGVVADRFGGVDVDTHTWGSVVVASASAPEGRATRR